jgi:hypothetical protein
MISKLQFSIEKYKKGFTAVQIFLFGHQNHGFGTGSGPQLGKMRDPDPH